MDCLRVHYTPQGTLLVWVKTFNDLMIVIIGQACVCIFTAVCNKNQLEIEQGNNSCNSKLQISYAIRTFILLLQSPHTVS